MSDCEHEFTRVDMRGNWSCVKCGIYHMQHLRTRAKAAEKERDELKAENERIKEDLKAAYSHIAEVDSKMGDLYYERDMTQQENERLKAENLAMRNCQNCADYNEYPHLRPFHCHSCIKYEMWKAVKDD